MAQSSATDVLTLSHKRKVETMEKFGKAIISGIMFCSFSTLPIIQPAQASDLHPNSVSELEIIDAPLSAVWDAIKFQRTSEPQARRVISASNGTGHNNQYVVEETFSKLPVIGEVVCRYVENEISNRKLQYKLVSSSKFKAFEGEWELNPLASGQTSVRLTSYVDTGLKLPFAGRITRDNTRKTVLARLERVEELAESATRNKIASSARTTR
jgi:hypothetical protein